MYACSFLLISRCCFLHDALLQHPLPPSLSNVWWDIKRRHWATRDGCTPRDGTCLQCLETVGFFNPSPTILEPKTCLKNPGTRRFPFGQRRISCTSSKVQSEIGIGWTWTWWPKGCKSKKTATFAIPRYHHVTSEFSCFRRHSELFIKLMELYRFFSIQVLL